VRVLFITTWDTACGIATYSANLIEAIEKNKDVSVEIFSDVMDFGNLVKLARDNTADVVHIQHEFGISIATEPLISLISKFRMKGTPVVITCHSESDLTNVLLDGVADAVILHNDKKKMCEKNTFSRFLHIPHGIPEIVFDKDKKYYRKKYKIPENAFVVGTCGFLAGPRAQDIENLMVNIFEKVRPEDDVYFNISTSAHRHDIDGSGANAMKSAIYNLASTKGFKDKIYVGTEFTPTDEFRERLFCCDMAFSTAPKIAESNSGAAADLISCKIPLIVNNSPHFSHLMSYSTVVNDLGEMADEIIRIYKNKNKVYDKLLNKAVDAINDLGYSKVAEKHVDLYKKVSSNFSKINKNEIVKGTRKILNKDVSVSIKLPNSLWQTLFLWTRIQNLVDDGHKIHLLYQNTGMMETAIFEYVFKPNCAVDFGEVGIKESERIVRLHSKSLAQNLITDVEDWVRRGNDVGDMFSFLGECRSYDMNLGDYSKKRGDDIVKNYPVVIDASLASKFLDLDFINESKEAIAVIGSPRQEKEIDSIIQCINKESYPVKKVVEDTRTRWYITLNSNKFMCGFGDGMVLRVINALPVACWCNEKWQNDFKSELFDIFSDGGRHGE